MLVVEMDSRCHILIFGAVLALTGCTMIPQYERPVAPVARTFPNPAETNSPTAATDLAWREIFTDERLKQLIGLALANNLDFRVAALNVEQSRAQYRITRAESFPTIDGSGSFTRSRAAGVTADSWSASIGTTAYEVDLFGRVRSLNRQALEKYFATAEAKRSAQISLVSEVASQYFTLRQAEAQLELAKQTLAAVQESYGLNQATFDAGASSELDLRTAEGQVQTAKLNVLIYHLARAQAENYLTLLVGEPLPVDLPAPRPFAETNLVAEVPAGLPSAMVERRPDILEAEHTLKAANADIGAARAAFFPLVQFTGSIGTTSTAFQKLFGAGTGVWSFSPQITLPIFTGGQNRADLDAAKIGTRIEVANYQKAIETAFREVADALAAVQSYAEQLETQVKLIAAQQRRYELANLRYRQGDDTYLNVLSAQQDLYSAQQSQLATQLDQLISRISLYQALGGGWK
jgi:multidrug efflux system outer membrane protein